MLRIDVRELRKGPVATQAVLSPSDPLFEGLAISLAEPLAVDGTLEATGRGDFFLHGRLQGLLDTACRRCLKDMSTPIEVPIEALFTADPDLQDDPSVYPLLEPVSHVDVSEAVREELALAASQFPLCKDSCAGLCQRCGADLNNGPCGCPASKAKP